jgi:hypothetical protein
MPAFVVYGRRGHERNVAARPPSFSPNVADPGRELAATADVDGDLRSDFVWQHETGGWIAVWYLWDNIVLDTSFLTPARVTDATWKIMGPR